MGTWILIFLISGALFYYMYQRHKKLVDSGKVIERERNFVEKAEDFIISPEVPDEVQKRIQTLPYAEMKVSMRTEGGGQSFLFTGSIWSAGLYRKNDEAGKTIYSFQYLNWKTHNGGIMYGDHMNMLLTSIEKMFLSIDPNTQVKTRLLETKTSHKFFLKAGGDYMSSWIMTVLFFAVVGVIYLVVSYIGNKIVDKGEMPLKTP